MISEKTISEVKSRISISEVVGHFISLKKNKACCPFHGEKTPSFSVLEKKGIFKCFGCDKKGNAITFLMEHEKMDYPTAITWLADKYNISIELEDVDVEEQKGKKDKKQAMLKLINRIAHTYHKEIAENWEMADHAGAGYIRDKRGVDQETADQFLIGFAPDGWRFITDKLINDHPEDYLLAKELGLCSTKNSKNFDFFRNRTIYPIYDERDNIVGFGGRALEDGDVKYFNSHESIVYNKSRVLFGLHQVLNAQKQIPFFILVEGYHDVISCHQHGHPQAVAPSGTSFTIEQAKLARRYTDAIYIMKDDDGPGRKSILKDIPTCIEAGFSKIQVSIPEGGKDADKILSGGGSIELNACSQDAVLWAAAEYWAAAGDNPMELANAAESICEILLLLPSDIVRDRYSKQIAKKLKVSASIFQKELSRIEKGKAGHQVLKQDQRALPVGVDEGEFIKWGFYELIEKEKTGYYFQKQNGKDGVNVSNFIVKPFFHIMNIDNNKRLIEIDNGFNQQVIDIESSALVSLEAFKKVCYDQGNFLFAGNGSELMRILSKISGNFPSCMELESLGWQQNGFFSWFNMAWHNGTLVPFSEMGIVDLEDKRYFSPAISKIYLEASGTDDHYSNDRYLKYVEPKINFEKWCELLEECYPGKAMAGAAFCLVGLFKDLVNKAVGKTPMMSCFGPKGSGKSEFARSLVSVFFAPHNGLIPPLNVHQATDFAFSKYLDQYKNCVVNLDEFDDALMREERFQAIKAAYDGAGRQRGKGGSKKKTETQQYNSAIVLTGQYLSTRDDNSALSRCLLLEFESSSEFSEAQKAAYQMLKNDINGAEHELTGMIVEILKLRDQFSKGYSALFGKVMSEIGLQLDKEKIYYIDRVLRNYAAVAACGIFISQRFKLPWDEKYIREWCASQVGEISALIQNSDALGEFWNIVLYLADNGQLEEGWHFKNEFVVGPSIKVKRKGIEQKFPCGHEEMLFIRLNEIHAEYLRSYRQQYGRNGMNKQSLLKYLENSPAYVGIYKSTAFTRPNSARKITSAMVLSNKKLGIDLINMGKPTASTNYKNSGNPEGDGRFEPQKALNDLGNRLQGGGSGENNEIPFNG